MNKYRLNQILEVLLFPLIDSEQGKSDYFLSCYRAYHRFIKSDDRSVSASEAGRKNAEFRRAKRVLNAYLTERNHWRIKTEDEVEMLWNLFFPLPEVEKYMEYTRKNRINHSNLEIISSYYILKIISGVSQALITYRDGVASIKQWKGKSKNKVEEILNGDAVFDKLETWNLLCRFTVPDIYIVAAAVENDLGMEALYEQGPNLALMDKLLIKVMQRGVAENHLHFNVGLDYETGWLYYTDLSFISKMEEKNWSRDNLTRLEMSLFRCLSALYFEGKEQKAGFRRWLDRIVPGEIRDIMLRLYCGEYEGEVERGCIHKIDKIYRKLKEGLTEERDYLLGAVYEEYLEYKTSSEFILLFQSYQYVKCCMEDPFFARLFLQYLRLKNEYYYKIHEKYTLQGLKYFQTQYNAAKRAEKTALGGNDLLVELFRSQARMEYLKKLEIRIAPDIDEVGWSFFEYNKCRKYILYQLYGQICKVFESYKRFIMEDTIGVRRTRNLLHREKLKGLSTEERKSIQEELRNSSANIPVLGIVFHFIKGEFLEDVSGDYCWKKEILSGERRVSGRMHRRYFIQNMAVALEEIRQTIPGIDEYIVGIDAASDENVMEPWMFAPAYKLIRSQEVTRPVVKVTNGRTSFSRVQNIGFTYHVGEDFRHIVSGLRHIDEVLEEFRYKAGDRLGHALALGVSAEQWAADNEVVAVPVLEHMENLLWIWGICIHGDLDLPVKTGVLEDRIIGIVHELYPCWETITIQMLYQTYKMKFDLSHREIAQRKADEEYRCSCWDNAGKDCQNIWTEETLLLTHYCPVFEERYREIKLVAVTKDEIALYRHLQEYLIHKIQRKGIYIEANPTSNITIGEFSNMKEHPVFYLGKQNEKADYHVMLTINSDDPAVFNTNVENELAYIYYEAEAKGMAKEETLEWIDKIRQNGMNASFIQKEKDAGRIIEEVEKIIRAVRKMLYEGALM